MATPNSRQSVSLAEAEKILYQRDAIGPSEAVRQIFAALFFHEPKSLIEINSEGINHVYKTTNKNGQEYLIRLHKDPNPHRVGSYIKAQWVTDRVRGEGIPAPHIIHVGNSLVPYSYEVQEVLPGQPADEFKGDKFKIWQQIGKYTAILHTIPAPGFGFRNPPELGQSLYFETWLDFIEHEINRLTPAPKFVEQHVFENKFMSEVKTILSEMKTWQFTPAIDHGDIALKNILVDKDGQVTGILDWDESTFHRVPHYSIATTFPW
ncbi:MAG TPA: aminoglycoside phosphotransferase family protein, partial [Flavobacterium sp.]|nr:aminoglycoside phosphotransferase family protein [Flavobacterium sp.]